MLNRGTAEYWFDNVMVLYPAAPISHLLKIVGLFEQEQVCQRWYNIDGYASLEIPHTSLLVRKFLVKNNTIIPYIPDMTPCYLSLFPKLKSTMNGRRFANIEEITTKSLKDLNAILKN